MKRTIEITQLQAILWAGMFVAISVVSPILTGFFVLNMNQRIKDLEDDNVELHKRLDTKKNR